MLSFCFIWTKPKFEDPILPKAIKKSKMGRLQPPWFRRQHGWKRCGLGFHLKNLLKAWNEKYRTNILKEVYLHIESSFIHFSLFIIHYSSSVITIIVMNWIAYSAFPIVAHVNPRFQELSTFYAHTNDSKPGHMELHESAEGTASTVPWTGQQHNHLQPNQNVTH